jgi:hypothetical protein
MEVEQGSPQARATMGSLHHLTSSCVVAPTFPCWMNLQAHPLFTLSFYFHSRDLD